MAAPCPSEVAFLTSATCVVMPTSSRCRGSAFGLKAWILQVLPPSWRTSDSGDESRLDPSPVEPCRVCLEGGGTNRQLHLIREALLVVVVVMVLAVVTEVVKEKWYWPSVLWKW